MSLRLTPEKSIIPAQSLEEPDVDQDGVRHFFMSSLSQLDPFIFTRDDNVYNILERYGSGQSTDNNHRHIIGDGVDRIDLGCHGPAYQQLERMQWGFERLDTLLLWPGEPLTESAPDMCACGHSYESHNRQPNEYLGYTCPIDDCRCDRAPMSERQFARRMRGQNDYGDEDFQMEATADDDPFGMGTNDGWGL